MNGNVVCFIHRLEQTYQVNQKSGIQIRVVKSKTKQNLRSFLGMISDVVG